MKNAAVEAKASQEVQDPTPLNYNVEQIQKQLIAHRSQFGQQPQEEVESTQLIELLNQSPSLESVSLTEYQQGLLLWAVPAIRVNSEQRDGRGAVKSASLIVIGGAWVIRAEFKPFRDWRTMK